MLSVRLGDEIESKLNFLSKEKNISKNQIIKDSLLYYFEILKKESKQRNPYELGSDFFGKYSSGSDNLSTTYKQKLKDKINAKNDNR